MSRIHYYENISEDMTVKVNSILNNLQKISNRVTESEKQYLFLTQLQALPLSESQVSNIYCNTNLQEV